MFTEGGSIDMSKILPEDTRVRFRTEDSPVFYVPSGIEFEDEKSEHVRVLGYDKNKVLLENVVNFTVIHFSREKWEGMLERGEAVEFFEEDESTQRDDNDKPSSEIPKLPDFIEASRIRGAQKVIHEMHGDKKSIAEHIRKYYLITITVDGLPHGNKIDYQRYQELYFQDGTFRGLIEFMSNNQVNAEFVHSLGDSHGRKELSGRKWYYGLLRIRKRQEVEKDIENLPSANADTLMNLVGYGRAREVTAEYRENSAKRWEKMVREHLHEYIDLFPKMLHEGDDVDIKSQSDESFLRLTKLASSEELTTFIVNEFDGNKDINPEGAGKLYIKKDEVVLYHYYSHQTFHFSKAESGQSIEKDILLAA